jgi:hypothetical protein
MHHQQTESTRCDAIEFEKMIFSNGFVLICHDVTSGFGILARFVQPNCAIFLLPFNRKTVFMMCANWLVGNAESNP